MRRRQFLALFPLTLALSACGAPQDTTVAPPPASQVFTSSSNAQITAILAEWKRTAPESMRADGVRPETIEENVYQTSATLQEVTDFYRGLTQKGWFALPRMPGLKDGILLAGYEIGTTAVVIGALDGTPFGTDGVIVYTLKGTK